MLTQFILEHIPVFRALLKSEIEIEIGLFSRLPIRTSPRKNADSVHAKKNTLEGTNKQTDRRCNY